MKILDGLDRAKELGFETYRQMVESSALRAGRPWNGKVGKKKVEARIDWGRWLVDCPCGGAALVTAEEPFTYCTNCGNGYVGGEALTVVFPPDRAEIEAELLLRPMYEVVGAPPTQAALMSKPQVFGLERGWKPGETVKDLQEQRESLTRKEGVSLPPTV